MGAARAAGLVSVALLLGCVRGGFEASGGPVSGGDVGARAESGEAPNQPAMRWLRRFGGAGNDSGDVVTTDTAGNVYAAGAYLAPATFETTEALPAAGADDVLLASLTPTGTLRWVMSIGGAANEAPAGLAVLGGTLLVASRFDSKEFPPSLVNAGKNDVALTGLAQANGALGAGLGMGGSGDDAPAALVAASTGIVYVGGSFEGTATFGSAQLTSPGTSAGFVVGVNPLGSKLLSAITFGSTGNAVRVTALALESDGRLYVAGQFTGSVTLCGQTYASAGGNDSFLALMQPTGACAWSIHLRGPGEDHVAALAATPGGGVVGLGTFSSSLSNGVASLPGAGGIDTVVISIDIAGHTRWGKSFGGAGDERGTAIVVGSLGNIFFTGDFTGNAQLGPVTLTATGGTDIFLASLDQNGVFRWAGRHGSTGDDRALGLAISPPDGVFLTGSFCGPLPVDLATVTPAGLCDGFLARLAP